MFVAKFVTARCVLSRRNVVQPPQTPLHGRFTMLPKPPSRGPGKRRTCRTNRVCLAFVFTCQKTPKTHVPNLLPLDVSFQAENTPKPFSTAGSARTRLGELTALSQNPQSAGDWDTPSHFHPLDAFVVSISVASVPQFSHTHPMKKSFPRRCGDISTVQSCRAGNQAY